MAQLHKNIGFAGIGQFVYTILAFALIPFASRYLGDEGFGIYSMATAVGFFVSLLTDMGTSTLLTREISKHQHIARPLFAIFMGIKSILVLITIGLLLLYLNIGNFDTVSFHCILIFSFSSILSSVTTSAFSVFRGFEKIQYETIGISIDKFLSVFLGILFLVLGLDIRIFIFSFVVAAVVKFFVCFAIVNKRFVRPGISFNSHRSKIIVFTAIPFGMSALLAVCYNYIDILMLYGMSTVQDVGLYSGSYKFLNLTTLVHIVLTTAFLPQLSKNANDRKTLTDLFLKGTVFLFIVSIPMVPVTVMFANWMVMILLGPDFQGAVISLQILVFAAFAQMLNAFFVSLYAAVNKQKKIMYFQIIGLLVNLVLNVVLIPIISYRGAAIATIVTEWSILLMIVIWAQTRIFTGNADWGLFGSKVLRIIGSTAITIFILWYMQVRQLPDILSLGIGGVVYVLCLQLFRLINVPALLQSVLKYFFSGERT